MIKSVDGKDVNGSVRSEITFKQKEFNNPFKELFFPSQEFNSPDCYNCPVGKKKERCREECLDNLSSFVRQNHNDIFAIIIDVVIDIRNSIMDSSCSCIGRQIAI